MEHTRTDNPWLPGWDPSQLATLKRPDPRYYQHVPDLSGYFAVAHYQTSEWRPGEGDPASLHWLRMEAPELMAGGRLRVGSDDVEGGTSIAGTSSCLVGGGGGLADAGPTTQQQKSPSSAPSDGRPFNNQPFAVRSGGESRFGGQEQRDQQCQREGWPAGQAERHPHPQQRYQQFQDGGFRNQQPGYQHDGNVARGKKYEHFHNQRQKSTFAEPKNYDSSDDPARSWVWPDTSDVASSGQQSDPRQLRIRPEVLVELHRFPIGHPQSPWGWPENSDESAVTEETNEESVATREARWKQNAEIRRRAAHPQRYIRPSSPSTVHKKSSHDMGNGSKSSSSSGFAMPMPMPMPNWPGTQDHYIDSRDSPSYLQGMQRFTDESKPHARRTDGCDVFNQRHENYGPGAFDNGSFGVAAGQGQYQQSNSEARKPFPHESRYDNNNNNNHTIPRWNWDDQYHTPRHENAPFKSSMVQPSIVTRTIGGSAPPSHLISQRYEPSRDSWPTDNHRRQQLQGQQQQQPRPQRYTPSDW